MPPPQQSSSVPGLREPGSVSQADRNSNPNELKALTRQTDSTEKSKTCTHRVTAREDIPPQSAKMGQRLPLLQPLLFLPDTPSGDLGVFAWGYLEGVAGS